MWLEFSSELSSPFLDENGSRGVLQDPLDDQKGRSSKLMKLKFSPGSFLLTEIREMSIDLGSRGFSSQLTNHEDFTLLWVETRRDPASSARWKGTRLGGGLIFTCVCVWKISPPVWIEVGRKGKCEAETSCRGNRFSTPPSPFSHYPTEFVT